MGRSLDTIALHIGTCVLSQDPYQKRKKIMSPWVGVIINLASLLFYNVQRQHLLTRMTPFISSSFLLVFGCFLSLLEQLRMMSHGTYSKMVEKAFDFLDT